MKSTRFSLRFRCLLAAVFLFGPSLAVFAQPIARFYIGETEKNVTSPADKMPSPGKDEGDMVIFRIGQKTIPDVEKVLRLSIDGLKQGVGELVVVSGLVSGDTLKSLGLSVPIPIGSRGGSRSRLGFLPQEMVQQSTGNRSVDKTVISTWKPDALRPALRLWIASKAHGLVTPPPHPDPAYEELRRLVVLQASNARKMLESPEEDMLVMFATGSAQCDAACSAGTEVLVFPLAKDH